jgi:putative hydrolase
MEPTEALDEIAYLLEADLAPTYRVNAFRNAITTIRALSEKELSDAIKNDSLQNLSGIGPKTAQVVIEASRGEIPEYLQNLRNEYEKNNQRREEARPLREKLRGDCHTHSDWSDGGSPIKEMALTAKKLGHQYIALTDHSPNLTVANGLTPERLREQLKIVEDLNSELSPFRILTGIEVDIMEDGALDQEDELLAQVDLVVASVHSKLRMESPQMTKRMVTALANPHCDILGHCTGRMVVGKRKRPESTFDAELVFHAAQKFNKAIEINSRPERLDPPRRLMTLAKEADCLFSIDSDSHAPGQLEWLTNGCIRAIEVGIEPERIVNTKAADELLEWTASHEEV